MPRLLALMFLTQTSLLMARPATTYRALELGAGAWEIGLLTASFGLLPALAALPLGRLTDRGRAGDVLITCVVLLAVAPLVIATAPTVAWLAVGASLHGLGALAAMVGAQALVAQRSAAASFDAQFGHLTAFVSLGQMVGPLCGGVVASVVPSSDPMAWVCVSAAALCVICLPFVVRLGKSPATDAGHRAVPVRALDLLRRPGVLAGMMTSIALLTVVDLLIAFLPLLGERRGLSPMIVGLLLSVRAAMSVASRLLLGRMRRLWSRRALVIGTTGVAGLFVAAVPSVDNVWLLVGAMSLTGFLIGIGQPLTMSHLAQVVPARAVGAALSLRLTGNKMGQASMPVVVGLAAGAWGVAAAFWLGGALLLLAALSTAAPQRRP